MSKKRTPKRVEINGKWYFVRKGWSGRLELYEQMKIPEYTADEPYAHLRNFYNVYHPCGKKIGDIHTDNLMCSGAVSNFEC